MNVPPGQSGRPDAPGNGAGRDASEAGLSPESGWLLRHRVTVPEPPAGYCERRQLASRFVPTRQRVTVFAAPGGFGKTTLLAAGCRSAMARGVPVAWLTLDEEDDPAALDAYIAFACRRAGIEVLGRHGPGNRALRLGYPRTAALLQAMEVSGRTCVLALDELERVEHADAVALLSYLFRNAPACLHLALAYRQLPRGLDAAGPLLGGDAEILTARDLSFSKGEIARFFDLALSRRELNDIAAESGGWPIALRIWRNGTRLRATGESRAVRDAFDNWIEGRFWDQFPDSDRDLVLDIGLFDWIDSDLVEEVVEVPGAWRRVVGLAGLAGLLEPVNRDAPKVYRLHPLLRDHCAERRRRTPDRYRGIHRRIGKALARRGDTVEAMRHAAEADDRSLAGRILVDAGGLLWWLREGTDRLLAANRFLTDESVASNPRLGLARCAALATSGRLADARRAFDAALTAAARPFEPAFDIDRHLARGLLAIDGCEPVNTVYARAYMTEVRRIANSPTADPVLRGAMSYGLCMYLNRRAEFDEAVAVGRQGRRILGGRSTYLTMSLDAQLGEIAMARGQMRDALKRYGAATRTAKARFLRDPRLIANFEVLTREVALERDGLPAATDGAGLADEFYRGGNRLQHYASTAEVALERALRWGGVDAALSALDDMWAHARKAELQTLDRLLAALKVSLLADAGRATEAGRTWRDAALPATDTGCLDLDALGWREMEAIACARLRLLIALGAYGAGRRLADAVDRLTAGRGLLRMQLRALALRVRLEQIAGAEDDARPYVAEYLRLYAETDYAWPMVTAGAAATAALTRFVRVEPQGPLTASAGRLLAVVQAQAVKPGHTRLTGPELEVLRRLPAQRDKQIAAALGLSSHGVRYRIRGIFRKLQVGRRAAAVRRARALGILPPED